MGSVDGLLLFAILAIRSGPWNILPEHTGGDFCTIKKYANHNTNCQLI